MIIIRHTFQTKRGAWRQASEILKQAAKKGQFPHKPARMSIAMFGTMDQIAVEYEVESLEGAMKAKKQPWWEDIEPYLDRGDTLETWVKVDLD